VKARVLEGPGQKLKSKLKSKVEGAVKGGSARSEASEMT